MSKECAFCPSKAKLSGEHLWSEWMSRLLPGRKQLTMRGPNREVISARVAASIDWKANVVCEDCNNSWMSDLENNHAKPAMADLMLGKTNIPVDQARARSLALFTFKTAVVLDHLTRNPAPFFARSVRHEFGESLAIPSHVRMWFNAFAPAGRGEANTFYKGASLPESKGVEMYVCTFLVEHLVLQLVACKVRGFTRLARKDKFLAVPFWPEIPLNVVWPPDRAIMTLEEFDLFSDGWKTLDAS
jgi:hypothetical protein